MEQAVTLQTGMYSGALLAALAACLLPLFSFLVLLPFGKKLPRQGDWLAIATTAAAFVLAVAVFLMQWNTAPLQVALPWFAFPGAAANPPQLSFYLDNLSALMLVVVTFISLLVKVFSVAYMHHDPQYNRYFAYLSFFTFSMLGLLVVENLLLLFMFWELVGFASYLLIGFWFERKPATNAAKKAFLVNRVGDIGLLLGIFVLYSYFGSFSLIELKAAINQFAATAGGNSTAVASVAELSPVLLTLGGLGLFLGCVGKSAQFPLQIWLPDAMEGPTPVSSLIHAATMVAAGIYLLARCFPFFTPDALLVIAITGAITALLGALAALTQYDIKRILAYSTISQLGYMVMGMGVGAYDASLFHLITHAFFKAALFLLAGIVIHAMHQAAHTTHQEFDAQDIRQMGGLRKVLPITFICYLVAGAALVGLPLTSGFLSKDAIIAGAWAWAELQADAGNALAYFIPVAGFLVVLLTAYYMGRQMWLVFMGTFRQSFPAAEVRLSPSKETSVFMLLPVMLLALFSVAFVFSLNPVSSEDSWVRNGLSYSNLNPFLYGLSGENWPELVKSAETGFIHTAAALLSVMLALTGLGYALIRYRARAAAYIVQEYPKTWPARFAFRHFYLDAVFNTIFVKPAQKLSEATAATDTKVIDTAVNAAGVGAVIMAKIIGLFDKWIVDGFVNLTAGASAKIGSLGKNLQNESLQQYYIFSVIGVVAIVLYLLL
ncbi:MAG: NADH-quinone oxidoreductase subunit L [Hymenobacteraceae bacterium]|nr:NADH-quinone oxidoreductase subunit L [Hymenobacteraceae bacterium]MDX5398074.1 NADH-quinone oxidoreductase subunit L [Hymenobacteraceae bacterium]MDX5443648.1 NADH-quinone oxidoreductase subunit L [Hymenobacteraceae bacterium]MDX5514145.1 NADH-quinone oxidoreductase subunit L [Hymenobacteraceae bacterium]